MKWMSERVNGARGGGAPTLLDLAEAEVLCGEVGIRVPVRHDVEQEADVASLDLDGYPGDRVVLKLKAPALAHKSDVGGVAVCDKGRATISREVSGMLRRSAALGPIGVSIHEFVDREGDALGELLLGLRMTDDFGPVVTLGLGGLDAERLRAEEPLIIIPCFAWEHGPENVLESHWLTGLLTAPGRGRVERVSTARLVDLLSKCFELGRQRMPPLVEFEINPLVFVDGQPVALDVLASRDRGSRVEPPARPLEKLDTLLRPDSIAIAGVSKSMNPGRVILENVLGEGFAREKVSIIKPGVDEILGCRAVPTITELPEPVDLLVLSVAASAVPDLVEEAIAGQKAESIVLIPGGMGETQGSESRADRIQQALERSRRSDWRGPLVNGGNCLGIRSVPGRFDTLFIPRAKLSFEGGVEAPLAVISQSGAFAVARSSKLWPLAPRYVISVGNQIDLTVGDYLAHFAEDDSVRVFACYVEGFRPLDGVRFLEAAEQISASGRTVILYRAGRTSEGVAAAVSHTAVVAGDYRVSRQLARRAGVVVADTIEDLEDLTHGFCGLENRVIDGRRLAAVSNAGFECVAAADHRGSLQLARLSSTTRSRVQSLVSAKGMESILEVNNPLDVSPIFDDEALVEAARALLEDSGVDVGLVGCVPLTPALATLEAGPGHVEDVEDDASVASRLLELYRQTSKAWVAVVDGGPAYDAFARRLRGGGIPTFSSIDRALRVLDACCSLRRRVDE